MKKIMLLALLLAPSIALAQSSQQSIACIVPRGFNQLNVSAVNDTVHSIAFSEVCSRYLYKINTNSSTIGIAINNGTPSNITSYFNVHFVNVSYISGRGSVTIPKFNYSYALNGSELSMLQNDANCQFGNWQDRSLVFGIRYTGSISQYLLYWISSFFGHSTGYVLYFQSSLLCNSRTIPYGVG